MPRGSTVVDGALREGEVPAGRHELARSPFRALIMRGRRARRPRPHRPRARRRRARAGPDAGRARQRARAHPEADRRSGRRDHVDGGGVPRSRSGRIAAATAQTRTAQPGARYHRVEQRVQTSTTESRHAAGSGKPARSPRDRAGGARRAGARRAGATTRRARRAPRATDPPHLTRQCRPRAGEPTRPSAEAPAASDHGQPLRQSRKGTGSSAAARRIAIPGAPSATQANIAAAAASHRAAGTRRSRARSRRRSRARPAGREQSPRRDRRAGRARGAPARHLPAHLRSGGARSRLPREASSLRLGRDRRHQPRIQRLQPGAQPRSSAGGAGAAPRARRPSCLRRGRRRRAARPP